MRAPWYRAAIRPPNLPSVARPTRRPGPLTAVLSIGGNTNSRTYEYRRRVEWCGSRKRPFQSERCAGPLFVPAAGAGLSTLFGTQALDGSSVVKASTGMAAGQRGPGAQLGPKHA